jgi:hypothetical protein
MIPRSIENEIVYKEIYLHHYSKTNRFLNYIFVFLIDIFEPIPCEEKNRNYVDDKEYYGFNKFCFKVKHLYMYLEIYLN